MKKIIFTALFIISTSLFASAQVLNAGGSFQGVPISGSTANGGVINIGKGVQGWGVGGGGAVSGGPLIQLIALAQNIVSRLAILSIGVALLAFFWFLIVFITKGTESPEKRQEGLKGMGYSILALFVMVSIWGIIGLLGNIFGTGVGGGPPTLEMPKVK
jgi:hypothetical protein